MLSGEPAASTDYDVDTLTRWTPYHHLDLHDQRVSVAVYGWQERDYWAVKDGEDEDGYTIYKLLPLDRA